MGQTLAWRYDSRRDLLGRIPNANPEVWPGTSGVAYYAHKTPYIGIHSPGAGVITYFVDLYSIDGWTSGYWYQPKVGGVNTDGRPKLLPYQAGTYGFKTRLEGLNADPYIAAGNRTGSRGGVAPGATLTTPYQSVNFDTQDWQTQLTKLQTLANRSLPSDTEWVRQTRQVLASRGYSTSEIEAYVRAGNDNDRRWVTDYVNRRKQSQQQSRSGNTANGNAGGNGGSGGAGGGAPTQNPAASRVPVSTPQVQTRLVVRMPSGYLPPTKLESIAKPALHQTFIDNKGKVKSLTYAFDYIPSNVRYNGLGSEWVEIPRAENFPFVDWSRYKLMKVSLSWVIAADRTEKGGAVVHDGMFLSVDAKMSMLREMATNKYPVSIVNMDDLLSVQLTRSKVDGTVRGMQFVITDLNFTAARRTTVAETSFATSPSKVSVAQCEMTLQEIPIETVQIMSLPAINIPFTPPQRGTSGSIPSIPDPGLFIYNQGPERSEATLNRDGGPPG